MSFVHVRHRGASRSLGLKRVAFALTGVLGIAAVATQVAPVPVARAAVSPRQSFHYSTRHGQLCYGWTNGVPRCVNAQYRGFSRKPIRTARRASSARHVASGGSGKGLSAWTSTGSPSYRMSDFRGDPYARSFGSCTWYAWYRHRNEPLMRLGNAASWPSRARAFGLSTGRTPVVGATVVFQPHVQGASGGGHAGHVEAVYGNGWFLISEMSFYWNGGGWGKVNYRYVHTGAGVSFIY